MRAHTHARASTFPGDGLRPYVPYSLRIPSNCSCSLLRFTQCHLSGQPLQPPCVVDELGNLFNKDALLQALLNKTLPPSLSYISGQCVMSVVCDTILCLSGFGLDIIPSAPNCMRPFLLQTTSREGEAMPGRLISPHGLATHIKRNVSGLDHLIACNKQWGDWARAGKQGDSAYTHAQETHQP
eukprot:1157720-Pelagomonas_calceolata.AAC.2